MARNDERDPARKAGTGAADGITQNMGPAFRPVAPQTATPFARRRPTAPVATPVDTATPQAIAGNTADAITARSTALAQGNVGRINAANNPMSQDAETMRRIDIASRGDKGSPMARKMKMQALAGQLAGSQAASQVEAAPVAGALAQGANAANAAALSGQQSLEQQQKQQQAGNFQLMGTELQETGANARTAAGIAGGLQEGMLRSATDLQTTQMQTRPQPQYTQQADGSLALLEGASATPVTTGEGQPFRPTQPGLAPADLLKAYNDQVNAIRGNVNIPADQQPTAIEALRADPIFAPLFAQQIAQPAGGAQQGGTPTLQQYIQGVRAANPGKQISDDELLAAYRSKYGN